MANWSITLFETARGDKPVENFIQRLNAPTIARTLRTVGLLEKYGPQIGMPHSRKISSDLYELRIRGKQEIRIIYAVRKKK